MVDAGIIGSRCMSSVSSKNDLKISIRISLGSDSRVRAIITLDESDKSG